MKKDPVWAVPILWRSEFRNTLVGLVRNEDLNLTDAIEIIAEAERWLTGREYSIVSHCVMNLAAQSKCSGHDCGFLGLVQDLRVTLVTADRQILRSFPEVSVTPEGFL